MRPACATYRQQTRTGTDSTGQSLEWFAALLREDDDGDVADEFLAETGAPGVCADPAVQPRGALQRVLATRKPLQGAWALVVAGWPVCAQTQTGGAMPG